MIPEEMQPDVVPSDLQPDTADDGKAYVYALNVVHEKDLAGYPRVKKEIAELVSQLPMQSKVSITQPIVGITFGAERKLDDVQLGALLASIDAILYSARIGHAYVEISGVMPVDRAQVFGPESEEGSQPE